MAASPEAKFTEETVLWVKHHTPKLMTFAISRPESYRFPPDNFPVSASATAKASFGVLIPSCRRIRRHARIFRCISEGGPMSAILRL